MEDALTAKVQSLRRIMPAINTEKVFARIDKVGACLSLACAMHCILMPFVLTLLPLLGLGLLAHSKFEIGMFIATVTLASASLCWGTTKHKESRILLFVVAAVVLFYLAGFSAHDRQESIYVAIGGICLAAGHIINRRLCNSCKECCKH